MMNFLIQFLMIVTGIVMIATAFTAWRSVPGARRNSKIIQLGAGYNVPSDQAGLSPHCGQVLSPDGIRRANATISHDETLTLLGK